MSQIQPQEVLDEFFGNYDLPEAKEVIDTLLEVAITSDNDQYANPKERDYIFYFCKQLQQLLEASHILNSKK